ncbi:MAG: class I SAM-dependent methyltransferase, partial [Pseudanabaena sp.]
TNIDFRSNNENVIAHNLLKGIPFPDQSFDVIYHSHVLEHFSRSQANFFLRECHRVLRHKGILRIAIPDLEQIVKTYLIALEQASLGSNEWIENYEWMLLEMYDQVVRNISGGSMAEYFIREKLDNQEFVLERCGVEAEQLLESGRKTWESRQTNTKENKFKALLKQVYKTIHHPERIRDLFLKVLLGKEFESLQIGRFRQSGEIHQWMYDRYSLSKLLKEFGFEKITQRSASDSFIPNWNIYNLDTEADGSIYKPDSLYMEAIKH